LVLLRPRGNILLMEMLNYAAELRDPRRLGVGKADEVSTRPLRLARDLIRSMSAKSFDIAKYEDHYRDRVKELIAAKRKGKTLELPDQQEEAPVINLLEALEKSLASHRPTRRKEAPRAKRRGKPRVPARA